MIMQPIRFEITSAYYISNVAIKTQIIEISHLNIKLVYFGSGMYTINLSLDGDQKRINLQI